MALRLVEAVVGPFTVRNGLSWIALILGVLTIWWLLFQPFVIPSDSMEPTLHGDPRFLRGDRIFVNKLVYGPRIPFTGKRIWRRNDPQRWDIVVFRTVEKEAQHPVLIKRIVGLPGERIQIRDGAVWANGQRLEPPQDIRDDLYYTRYLGEGEEDSKKLALLLAVYSNVNVPGLKNMTQEQITALKSDDLKPLYDALPQWIKDAADEQLQPHNRLQYGVRTEDEFSVIPPDCYLVLGDNSRFSGDGRIFGWVPGGNILGRASCIFWPVNRARDFTGFWHTWKGKAILYGLPAAFAAFEILTRLRRKKRRPTPQTL